MLLIGDKKDFRESFQAVGCCKLADVKSGSSPDSDTLPTVFSTVTLGKTVLPVTGITRCYHSPAVYLPKQRETQAWDAIH